MNNQTKLKNWGLEGEEKYYYLKYGENRCGTASEGTATICVIPAGSYFVRGVAFCNPIDQFSRKKGRAIALGRAVKAIEKSCFSDPIPNRKPAWMLERMLGWTYFSCWDITLTSYEKKLFKERKT